MTFPGYMLNPGDMFQVEPERVLFATGAPKSASERRLGRQRKAGVQRKQKTQQESSPADDPSTSTDGSVQDPPVSDPKESLRILLTKAKTLAATSISSAKRKQDLRAFKRLIKQTLSRSPSSTTLTDSLEAQFHEITSQLSHTNLAFSPLSSPPEGVQASNPPATAPTTGKSLPADEQRALREALEEARDNPIDSTKPYATPWRPRPYMSAFAFVPRYLEVHHKICSAVYLRHPVARAGLAEVPTPFGNEVNGLAFNWYLRRR